mmetsp:Transcript_20543/g.65808  ORF Transcript_20543/g.65808 Transcript_20543/m.65808 type:complete len:264 (+) Transcript_20543:2126-2917(+)
MGRCRCSLRACLAVPTLRSPTTTATTTTATSTTTARMGRPPRAAPSAAARRLRVRVAQGLREEAAPALGPPRRGGAGKAASRRSRTRRRWQVTVTAMAMETAMVTAAAARALASAAAAPPRTCRRDRRRSRQESFRRQRRVYARGAAGRLTGALSGLSLSVVLVRRCPPRRRHLGRFPSAVRAWTLCPRVASRGPRRAPPRCYPLGEVETTANMAPLTRNASTAAKWPNSRSKGAALWCDGAARSPASAYPRGVLFFESIEAT